MTAIYRTFVVASLLYLLFRHPALWGDTLWAVSRGASAVSTWALAQGHGGDENGIVEYGQADGRSEPCRPEFNRLGLRNIWAPNVPVCVGEVESD